MYENKKNGWRFKNTAAQHAMQKTFGLWRKNSSKPCQEVCKEDTQKLEKPSKSLWDGFVLPRKELCRKLGPCEVPLFH